MIFGLPQEFPGEFRALSDTKPFFRSGKKEEEKGPKDPCQMKCGKFREIEQISRIRR